MSHRVNLVSAEEMRAGFVQFVEPENLKNDWNYYSYLISQAGREVDSMDIVNIIIDGLLGCVPLETAIKVDMIIDAMVGEEGKDVGDGAKRIFANVAKIMAEKKS